MLASTELRRRAYLHALGIDQYVSRADPPGAAPTTRLALQPVAPERPSVEPVVARQAPPEPRRQEAPVGSTGRSAAPVAAKPPEPAAPSVRFSIAAIRAGGWLWLEDLGAMPLATEQVHLVKAMAAALSGTASEGAVAQFDWPIHRNAQLDQGPEAAAASLGSFVQRQLDDGACSGLVLLGEGVISRLAAGAVKTPQLVTTLSTRAMLEQPGLKRQVWRDLKPHAHP